MTDATTTAPSNSAGDRDLPPAGRAYLEAVSSHLADLDVADRGELVSDIADALAEQPKDATFETIVVALGSPSTFAAELRSAAGLPPVPAAAAAAAESKGFGGMALDRADAAVTWTARELEPMWWIVRGLLVALVLFVLTQIAGLNSNSDRSLIAALGLISVAVSVAVGVRARAKGVDEPVALRTQRLRGATTIVAGAIFAIVLANFVSSSGTTYYDGSAAGTYDEQGLLLDGSQVANIYAFDEDGTELKNVRLFTDTGAPLDVFANDGDPMREAFADRTGESIFNVFPIRHRDGENGEVVDRSAGYPDSPGVLRGASVVPAERAESATAVEPTAVAPAPAAAAEPAKPTAARAAVTN